MNSNKFNKQKLLNNICGLSKGDRAHCGMYGIVKCEKSASETRSGRRMFTVSHSALLANRSNWTFSALREAIVGA